MMLVLNSKFVVLVTLHGTKNNPLFLLELCRGGAIESEIALIFAPQRHNRLNTAYWFVYRLMYLGITLRR